MKDTATHPLDIDDVVAYLKDEESAPTKNNDNLVKEVNVAMSIPDDDISMPGRVRATSVTGNLMRLSVGDTYTLSRPLANDNMLADLELSISEMKEQIRSGTKSSIRNAKAQTGHTYRTEIFHVMAPSARVYIITIITRIS